MVGPAPITAAFADIICREQKLIHEVDGSTLSTAAETEADAHRATIHEAKIHACSHGFRIIRASNSDVAANIAGVLEAICAELSKLEGQRG